MASTRIDESEGRTEATRRRRFVSAPSAVTQNQTSSSGESIPAGQEEQDQEPEQGPLMSRRAAIGGVGMGAAALVCFVLGMGSGGPAGVSRETADEVFALQDEIRDVQITEETLPESKDADRGLVTAQTSADQIAKLQNQYRILTGDIAAAGGKIDQGAVQRIQRGLIPYFAPSVDQSALTPWYLLASDKDAPKGTGLAMSFDSGFRWVAQRPYLVSENSTVMVTWLAVQTHAPKGQEPAVLAWSRAEYDLVRKTFINLETGT